MNKQRRRRVYGSPRWKALRRRVADWTGEKCERCGGPAPLRSSEGARGDLHHRTDLAAGGDPWARENLEWLCGACHSKHTARAQWAYPPPADWAEYLE